MKCLHLTLRRMVSRTSIQSKLQAAPGRFTQATALKVSANYAATRHRITAPRPHVGYLGVDRKRLAHSQNDANDPPRKSGGQVCWLR